MSRVLLFVQTGDARPKCVKQFGYRRHSAMNYFRAIESKFGTEGQPERGWLVECENADAGRATIEHVTLDDNAACPINCPCCGGRILASGGKR